MPSPRDIPQVKEQWHHLPYDKLIVKYMDERSAYETGKSYFLEHDEYSHFVICPDDLVVTSEGLLTLLASVTRIKCETLSGVCNIDEEQPDTYALQPLGTCDYAREKPDNTFGRFYMGKSDPRLPKDRILQVGHSGFACQIISRRLMEQFEFTADGWFDWQFSKICHKLDIPLFADTSVHFYHMRGHSKPQIYSRAYSYLLKY